eukprot:SAG31_NODE_24365_length_483_cov_0.804688_1_plen_56_part_01
MVVVGTCHFCLTDRAHAVVDAARTQPPLCDLEPTTFAENHVRCWNAHIVEANLGVI